jgi:large conductance mechanosensitive channel
MKKFFGEFKKFITRGNVLDMSVGVIVGGAFTGIVNGLSNYILKPLVNWLIAVCVGSKNGLSSAITMLYPAWKDSGEVNALGEPIKVWDLANSIYIDWGSFISAIINFLIIAFVLFTIVKLINSFRDGQKKLSDRVKDGIPTKEERIQMKKDGIKLSNKNAVKAWLEQQEKNEAEAEAKAKAEAEEKAKADRLANPTTEDLLKDIKELLKNQAK